MQSIHSTVEDLAELDEEQLLAYLNDTIIPCAACDKQIEVDEAERWVNRLVCAECFSEYEGLTADDEENYDSVYEEQIDAE